MKLLECKIPYDIIWTTGDTTPIITNLSAGGYVFFVTDANGCEIQSNTILIQNTSSVAEVLLNQIIITPTLINEGVVNIDNVLTSTPFDFHLINYAGQLLSTEKGLVGNNQVEINQTSGVYFIKLNFGGTIFTKKILIID